MEIMHTAFLSIGSNLGDRLANLQFAVNELSNSGVKVLAASSVYETEPVGFDSEDWFLNACLKVETDKLPEELLLILNEIELKSGRAPKNSEGYESRPLDLDIIFYDQQRMDTPSLKIPHPRFRERLFVLLPLNDLDTEMIDPVSSMTVGQLLSNCQQEGILRKFNLTLLI